MAVNNDVNRIAQNYDIVKKGFDKEAKIDRLDAKIDKLEAKANKAVAENKDAKADRIEAKVEKLEEKKAKFELVGKLDSIVKDDKNTNLTGKLDGEKIKSALVNAGFENNPKLAEAVKSLQKGDVNQAAKLLIDGLSTQDKKNNKGATEVAQENKKAETPKKEDKNDGSKLLVEAAPKAGSVKEKLAELSQQIQETRGKIKANEEKAGAGVA
ncbi:MAG: hypothetical protein U0354_17265 [Candidatus Sericytochromatia bacterium]